MALSKAHKQILDQFHIPQELQTWIAQEFDEQGNPKGVGAPDFLIVLSDLLQAAEVYLDSQRIKLNRLQKPVRDNQVIGPEEWQVLLATQEEVVKEAWLRASDFWRVLDQVMAAPKEYGVTITRRHIEYAFQKKNLPLIEMLKWTKPEYFNTSSPTVIKKCWAGLVGCIGGFFSGLMGRIMGGNRQLAKRSLFMRPFLIIRYIIEAFFIGTMQGTVLGGSFGFQTGHPWLAIRLGYYAGWFNPFNDPIGSKNKQAVELKTQEAFFLLSGR